ncbi:MAG: aminoacyl-tRNA hydrolase [Acidobacteria bacterium]|nr:aminoacyl-tRNA hydrolase [Acidobacteriota bacterium]
MRLIVGLGNPGREYAETPHNLGFRVVERLAEQARLRRQYERAQARLWRGRLDQTEVLLAEPLTYMNLSGPAVAALLRGEDLTPADLIVVLDDVALPFGQLRIRERGSAGGHRGLESIVAALGTEEFVRLRLGIQPPEAPVGDLSDYVLAPMTPEEQEQAAGMVAEAAEAVRLILREGPRRAMERFNRRAALAPPQPGQAGN